MRRGLWVVCCSACCAGPIEDTGVPTGSTTMVAVMGRLVTANPTEDSVSWIDPETGDVDEVEVGAEPTRIAPVGDRAAVSLRAEGAVVLLDAHGREVARREVGAEPYGVVASADGERLYVAVSIDKRVLELDAEDLSVLRTFDLPGEPRWLALHQRERQLYVGSARGEPLWRVALRRGDIHPVDLLDPSIFSGDDRVLRVTGDPAISPDGARLVVPVLLVDPVVVEHDDPPPAPTMEYYVSPPAPSGPEPSDRFVPGVVVVELERDGAPSERRGFLELSGAIRSERYRRSYGSGVTFTPDGEAVWVPMEAAALAVRVSIGHAFSRGAADPLSRSRRTEGVPQDAVAGPLAVRYLRGEAYVHGTIDRAVAPLLDERAWDPMAVGIPVATSDWSPERLRGQQLFYGAADGALSGGDISCSTCHFEGREDALTWTIASGSWQTPSLAGPKADTLPLTWSSSVASIEAEADNTRVRMGGSGVPPEDLAGLATFVEQVRRPLPPTPGPARALARGERLFAQAGCGGCHAGDALTDGRAYALFGTGLLDTPTLRGVAATAPYLHDGRAETLREVLELSRDGVMGDLSGMSGAELDDLATFLETL